MSPTIIPGVLWSLHFPTSSKGVFAEGNLTISGLGKHIFPAFPCHTVVRTLPQKILSTATVVNSSCSFGGKVFLTSEHRYSNDVGTKGMHDIELIFPLSFIFKWDEKGDTNADIADMPIVVSPQHKNTTLLGIIPLPLWCMEVNQRMTIHSDDQGWDLHVSVCVFGGRVNLITYEGSMRLRQEHLKAKRERGAGGCGEFVDGFHDLVLFDGQCNLCNASVDFWMKRDSEKRLLFCTQQSPECVAILERYGYSGRSFVGKDGTKGEGDRSNDSVLVLGADGKLREKSDAALHVGEVMGGGWKVLAMVARVVPVGVRDVVYGWIGRHRYQWFGKTQTCRIPTPEERQRFLK